MLKIRHEQFDTLERQALRGFEDEMVVHLREFVPRHADGVGEAGLRTLIRAGVGGAKEYGYTLRGPVRFYIECMVMFGWKFDTDPFYPWAGPAMNYGRGGPELPRADRWHERVAAYRDAVFGENMALEKAAVGRLLAVPVSEWLVKVPTDAEIAKLLRDVYPEKFHRAGPTAAGAVTSAGRRLATDYGFPAGGAVVFAALHFAFGHGVMTDPQFPWVRDNLAATDGQPGPVRADKLATRALAYLSATLADES